MSFSDSHGVLGGYMQNLVQNREEHKLGVELGIYC